MFGNLADIVRLGRPEAFHKWALEYGPVFKVFQGGTVIVVVADAAGARAVNMRNHSRGISLSNFAGAEEQRERLGIIPADGGGPYWQALRQAWQTMFHPESLRQYMGFINMSSERCADALQPACESGDTVEVWRLMGCLTSEIVGSAALGIELDALGAGVAPLPVDPSDITFQPNDDAAAVAQKVAAIVFAGTSAITSLSKSPYSVIHTLFPELRPLVGRIAFLLPDQSSQRLLQARARMRDLCGALISETRGGMKGGAVPPRGPRGLPSGAFVHHLLRADNRQSLGRPFTDAEISAQISMFMNAGYETTASALAFTIYHLANNPAAESRLLEEIDAFGRTAVPTFNNLKQFPYLSACIDESLRIHPPAPGTVRAARQEMLINGFRIPCGTYLYATLYSIQRNPQYWDDPLDYRPERLLGPNGTSGPSWAPFGDGGRSCVGMKLAYAEAVVGLVRVYQRFTFRLTPGQVPLKMKYGLTISPAAGIHVKVHPRT